MRIPATLLVLGLVTLTVGVETACVPQERVTGRATVTDGDSIEIGATRIRLFGVDAPEGRQPCTRDGREWACGNEAARRLRSLVATGDVACIERDVDDYGRMVAQCTRGNVDLAAEMARAGLAVAYRRYSNAYVDEENEARAARRGLWAGEFTPPEQWRRDGREASPAPSAPATAPGRARSASQAQSPAQRRAGCNIKGNINGEGERIYHVPGAPSYDNTRIDESAGERWFCSEAEAEREGWRAPRG